MASLRRLAAPLLALLLLGAPAAAASASDNLDLTAEADAFRSYLRQRRQRRVMKQLHQSGWDQQDLALKRSGGGSGGGGGTQAPASSSPPASLRCANFTVTQPLDHGSSSGPSFSLPGSNKGPGSTTWTQRVYVCSGLYKGGADEPVYFYAGCEETLDGPYPSIFADVAQQQGAGLLVYAEHRYYGRSLPLGSASLDPANLKYLTIENALADYAAAIRAVRKAYKVPSSAPAVVYGGSYGGNLAAYLRLAYPEDFTAALASSAVVKMLAPSDTYKDVLYDSYKVVSETVREAGSESCADMVQLGFETLAAKAGSSSGRSALEKAMGFCNSGMLTSAARAANAGEWLRMGWWGAAQHLKENVDNMVDTMCSTMARTAASAGASDRGLAAVTGLTAAWLQLDPRKPTCAPNYLVTSNSDWPVETMYGDDPDSYAYSAQSCMEGAPWSSYFGSKADDTIFADFTPDWEAISAWCQENFGLSSEPTPPSTLLYDEEAIKEVGNIVFSNGGFDPWSAGSVLEDLSDTVKSVIIPRASHCADLSADKSSDPEALLEARATIKELISGMLDAAASSGRRRRLMGRRALPA